MDALQHLAAKAKELSESLAEEVYRMRYRFDGIFWFSFVRIDSQKATAFVSKGDSFYRSGEYKAAALSYSNALVLYNEAKRMINKETS